MRASKDVLANTGGWIALNDADWAERAAQLAIMTEGFVNHGGHAGGDLEAIASGLGESCNEHYLRHRIESTRRLGERLQRAGVTVLQPFGGHVVVVDAQAWLPPLSSEDLPAQTHVAALYAVGGVRACDVSATKIHRSESGVRSSYVKLGLPRHCYTDSHWTHVEETFGEVFALRKTLSPTSSERHLRQNSEN